MIGPLLLLAGVVLFASQKKRAATRAPSNIEQEAERIVRESKEIIHGQRDSYSDPEDSP